MSDSRRTPVEHSRKEQAKSDSWSTKQDISDAIDGCARLLARAGPPDTIAPTDPYEDIAEACLDGIAPFLQMQTGQPPTRYGRELSSDPDYDHDALRSLILDEPREIHPSDFATKRLVERAYYALATVAEHEGIIESEYGDSVRVEGHALPLGKMHTKWEDTIEGPVRIVNRGGSPPVSITQGTRGFGKSTSIATEALDRYHAGKKIIDMADLSELENGVYDLPQQQPDLREVREELDLPAGYDEAERDPPEVEILVPLTPSLDEEKIPCKQGSEETVVQPFTIPAADIPRRVLNMMLSHLTDVQQTYLDRAYRSLSERKTDWSLLDLADAVLHTDAQDGVKRRVYNTLAELQSVGFIRTRECAHAIDWERIFRDEETITAFSMSKMDEKAHKFMVMCYLTESVWKEREEYHALPSATTIYRELHNIAPTDRVASEDEREREIQSGLVSAFQDFASEGRHVQTEILADTQQFIGQVNKRVREHVERVVTFRSQFGVLKPLFKSMIGLDGDRFNYMTTIAREFETGQAAVLGYTGTNRSLEMPIDFAPPLCHHIDVDNGESGWRKRTEVLDEELRPAPWDASVPEKLQFEELSVNADGGDEELGRVELFANQYVREQPGNEVHSDQFMQLFEDAMAENGRDTEIRKSVLSKQLRKHIEFESEKRGVEKDTYWLGVGFSPRGERLRDGEVNEAASAD